MALRCGGMTFRRSLTRLGVLTAHPIMFLILAAYTAAWIIFDSASLDMHGIAALSTWLMTLFIQRATHRDTQAIQAKLDELIRSHDGARNSVAEMDQREPEEIEKLRARSA